jgi:hypothetical protein
VARSENVAAGYAYYRDPEEVEEGELPWQDGYQLFHMRRTFKRLARVFAREDVPQRQFIWANSAPPMLESTSWDTQLVEGAGAQFNSYELDMVTIYPPSLHRFQGNRWSGLVARVVADQVRVPAGDDPRIEHQMWSRALLHDFGICPTGPHGVLHQQQENSERMNALTEFGFFNDDALEFIPYWRNEAYVALDGVHGAASDDAKLFVSMYRAPLADGEGYKVLFVLGNENHEAVEIPFELLDPSLLGGDQSLTVGGIRSEMDAPAELESLWSQAAGASADRPALRDFDTGRPVIAADGSGKTYGPVFIPRHGMRLLVGEFRPE